MNVKTSGSNAHDDGRKDAGRRRGQSAAQILDDRLPIDRIAERLTHAAILQHRVAQVQADILIVGPRRLDDLQLRVPARAGARCRARCR